MTGNVLFLFVEVFRLFQNLGLMLVYVCFVSDLCMDRFCRFDLKKGLHMGGVLCIYAYDRV